MDLEELGFAALKTSPSGGARHPIEAYVVARRVRGLRSGLYHYAPDTHELERLRNGATSRTLATFLGGQPWYGNASALVVLTSVVERKMWLYHYPRSYRILLLEAGHLVQTFCLIATSLGLAPFCSAALADSRIEREFGLDGIREPILYAAGVGPRPSDERWAPWPNRDDPPRVIEPGRR